MSWSLSGFLFAGADSFSVCKVFPEVKSITVFFTSFLILFRSLAKVWFERAERLISISFVKVSKSSFPEYPSFLPPPVLSLYAFWNWISATRNFSWSKGSFGTLMLLPAISKMDLTTSVKPRIDRMDEEKEAPVGNRNFSWHSGNWSMSFHQFVIASSVFSQNKPSHRLASIRS
ncbi:hypothetical protein OGAPHI_004071 [Ogataea philodendri]|uniref:Uncharacterized protein n=1 Tax=Ogataea philodendri TaxID=1378263 RepID=A0A9P8P600_9ASCO|nr:uncharacterized protein OGAPHI_004071 [Ogataea philodendri]KAH3665882.1 hypothetical protein OGAPHI_004071 [Ogataea philodendri]